MPPKLYECKLVNKTSLGGEIHLIRLEQVETIRWVHGHFLVVEPLIDGVKEHADYTIISPPGFYFIELLIEVYPESVIGRWIVTSELGTSIHHKGARGRFQLELATGNKVFIAEGIGITPFLSFLQQLGEDFNGEVHLYHFRNLTFPNLDDFFEILFSKSGVRYHTIESTGEIELGKISRDFLEEYFAEHKDSAFYISVFSDFVKGIRPRFKRWGVEKIEREIFGWKRSHPRRRKA